MASLTTVFPASSISNRVCTSFIIGLLESIDILIVQRLEQLFSKVSVQLLYMYTKLHTQGEEAKSFVVHIVVFIMSKYNVTQKIK